MMQGWIAHTDNSGNGVQKAQGDEKGTGFVSCTSLTFDLLNWFHKPSDFSRGHGEIRFENGAYTVVREYFEPNFNTAPG